MDMGKILMILGGLAVAAGLFITLGGHKWVPLGRLPGDILLEKQNMKIYFPITTCLLLSLVLSGLLYLLGKLK